MAGVGISVYAIENSEPEVRDCLRVGHAAALPWENDRFDFIYSINTLHNLDVYDLKRAIWETERVGRNGKWLCVESYRSEREKVNLLYWQRTCMNFYNMEKSKWLLRESCYAGEIGFVVFE